MWKQDEEIYPEVKNLVPQTYIYTNLVHELQPIMCHPSWQQQQNQ